jgi:hypothetical protein
MSNKSKMLEDHGFLWQELIVVKSDQRFYVWLFDLFKILRMVVYIWEMGLLFFRILWYQGLGFVVF